MGDVLGKGLSLACLRVADAPAGRGRAVFAPAPGGELPSPWPERLPPLRDVQAITVATVLPPRQPHVCSLLPGAEPTAPILDPADDNPSARIPRLSKNMNIADLAYAMMAQTAQAVAAAHTSGWAPPPQQHMLMQQQQHLHAQVQMQMQHMQMQQQQMQMQQQAQLHMQWQAAGAQAPPPFYPQVLPGGGGGGGYYAPPPLPPPGYFAPPAPFSFASIAAAGGLRQQGLSAAAPPWAPQQPPQPFSFAGRQ